MATKPMGSRIMSIPPTDRIRRCQIRHPRLYQEWRVRSIGVDRVIAACEYAINHTRNHWKDVYTESLSRQSVHLLLLMRMYLALHGVQILKVGKFTRWAHRTKRLPKSFQLRQAMNARIARLVNAHFVNPLGGGHYALTLRTLLLTKILMEHFDAAMLPFEPEADGLYRSE